MVCVRKHCVARLPTTFAEIGVQGFTCERTRKHSWRKMLIRCCLQNQGNNARNMRLNPGLNIAGRFETSSKIVPLEPES